MAFQVFQDGKPADKENYPELKGCCWANSRFNEFEMAVRYAHIWAYPYTWETLPKDPARLIHMEVNVPVNMSQGEDPVWMEIRYA